MNLISFVINCLLLIMYFILKARLLKTNSIFRQSPEEKNVVGVREGVTHFFDDERKVLRVMPDIQRRYLVDTFHQFNDETELPRVYDWNMVRDIVL